LAYQIKLDNFSGPFDLLCHLIENAELDICAISLAQVVDQYVSYVTSAQDCTDLDAIGEFLILATRLLLIKVRVLLPSNQHVDPEQDELGSDQDTQQLVHHLRQYRLFRDLGRKFGEIMEKEAAYTAITSVQCEDGELISKPEPLLLELDTIVSAWVRMAPLFVRPSPMTFMPKYHTVEEELLDLKTYLDCRQSLSIKRYLGNNPSRLRLVTVLLAVLELWRQGNVSVWQAIRFGDILVAHKEGPTCKSNH